MNKDISRKFDDRKGIVFEPNFILFGKLRPYLKNWLFPNFKGIALGDFWVFEPNDSSSIFNYYLIQSNKYQTVANLSSGTKMPRSDWKTVSETEFSIPVNIEEQTKIGSFFKQLDNTITLHQDAIQHQQDLKKAMLQKLFPVNGTRIPTVRFATFKEEWEQRKLREVGNVVTGSTPSTLDKTNYNGSYLFVSPADIQGNRYVDKTITTLSEKGFRKGRILKEGAILFVSIGSTIGKVAQIRQEAVTNQQINAVVPHEDYDDNFIFSSLVKESEKIRLLSATQAVPIINKTTFSNIDIHIPGNIKEQIQIGAFFNKIDDTIALHQDAIHKLQLLKQSFLQKMFIN